MESAFGMSVGSTSALPLGYYLTLTALLQLLNHGCPLLRVMMPPLQRGLEDLISVHRVPATVIHVQLGLNKQ